MATPAFAADPFALTCAGDFGKARCILYSFSPGSLSFRGCSEGKRGEAILAVS